MSLPPNYHDNNTESEEEIFARSPKIIKYDLKDKENLSVNDKVRTVDEVKSKNNKVPSNITCHCAGKPIYH